MTSWKQRHVTDERSNYAGSASPAADIARLDDLITILTRHASDHPCVLVVTNDRATHRADLPAIRGVAESDNLRDCFDGLLGLGATTL